MSNIHPVVGRHVRDATWIRLGMPSLIDDTLALSDHAVQPGQAEPNLQRRGAAPKSQGPDATGIPERTFRDVAPPYASIVPSSRDWGPRPDRSYPRCGPGGSSSRS